MAVPVRRAPQLSAEITRHLWPDQIMPIWASTTGWLRTGEGYVEKTHLQPVILEATSAQPVIHQPPFWAEVAAPVAVIRQWCAADAPLVTRIGHGGVVRVIDYLPDRTPWYGVADENGALFGWSQAAAWRLAALEHDPRPLEIVIHRQTQQMTIFAEMGKPLLQADVATGEQLASGTYTLEHGCAGGERCRADYGAEFRGVPWHLHIGNQGTLHGAYWHNQFGESLPGANIQLVPYLARWLYRMTGPGSRLVIGG